MEKPLEQFIVEHPIQLFASKVMFHLVLAVTLFYLKIMYQYVFFINVAFCYFIGPFQCPICRGHIWYTNYKNYLKHSRSFHGPAVFPYTCSICYSEPADDAPCYPSLHGFMYHWEKMHPEVGAARDIVHPEYGKHYLTLPYQMFSDWLGRNVVQFFSSMSM